MGISVIFARGLQQAMKLHGRDPALFLQSCQLHPARLRDLRQMLRIEEAEHLVRCAIEETADAGLGLTVGVNTTPIMLQLLGLILVAQRSMRDAFDVLQRYSCLMGSGMTWELVESNGLARISCAVDREMSDDLTRFMVEYALAVTKRVGRQFAPPGRALFKAQFRHAAPSYWPRYWDVFQCPIEFDQTCNALVFPRDFLDLVQLHADPLLDRTMRRAADKLLRERETSHELVERLNLLLHSERALAHVDHQALARGVGMSLRSLRQKLHREGLALSQIIVAARIRYACDELLRPGATIVGTARHAGFSEASAFHRAFKRWLGCTPRQYLLGLAPSAQIRAA